MAHVGGVRRQAPKFRAARPQRGALPGPSAGELQRQVPRPEVTRWRRPVRRSFLAVQTSLGHPTAACAGFRLQSSRRSIASSLTMPLFRMKHPVISALVDKLVLDCLDNRRFERNRGIESGVGDRRLVDRVRAKFPHANATHRKSHARYQ